jgi:hypothetical protein
MKHSTWFLTGAIFRRFHFLSKKNYNQTQDFVFQSVNLKIGSLISNKINGLHRLVEFFLFSRAFVHWELTVFKISTFTGLSDILIGDHKLLHFVKDEISKRFLGPWPAK